MSEPLAAAPEPAAVPTGGELVRFQPRNSLNAKVNYARHLAESGLLPAQYRKQPANVLYACEYGEMLGLSPMAAITGIHIIEGKPTASAALISALVRRAGHRLRVTCDQAAMTATAEIVRSDDPDFTFRSVWNLDRAVAAGLCQVKNGKPFARSSKGEPLPWEKYTVAMLKARAVSEVARDACEEALSGVHYTPEELGADVDEDGIPNPNTRVEQVVAQPDVDWDAEIVKCGGDRDALSRLWRQTPRDSEARAKVEAAAKAAAKAAAAKAAEAKPAEPDQGAPQATVDGEVVDAELLDPATDPKVVRGRSAAQFVDLLVDAGPDAIDTLYAEVSNSGALARTDVSGLLKPDQREALAVTGKLTLEDLAVKVMDYLDTHKCSVNTALYGPDAA